MVDTRQFTPEKKEELVNALARIFRLNLHTPGNKLEKQMNSLQQEMAQRGVSEEEFEWLRTMKGDEFSAVFGEAALLQAAPKLVEKLKATDRDASRLMGTQGHYRGFYPSK